MFNVSVQCASTADVLQEIALLDPEQSSSRLWNWITLVLIAGAGPPLANSFRPVLFCLFLFSKYRVWTPQSTAFVEFAIYTPIKRATQISICSMKRCRGKSKASIGAYKTAACCGNCFRCGMVDILKALWVGTHILQ